jgi:putative addiction module component (TIGR02574 family)
MSTDFDSLSTQAMSLPPEQRVELAQRLWESVEGQPEVDEALLAEIDRREAELDSGTVPTYSHDEVMRDARTAIGE